MSPRFKTPLPHRWLSVDPGLKGAVVFWEDHWPVAVRDIPTHPKPRSRRGAREVDLLAFEEMLCGLNAGHVAIEDMYVGRAGKSSIASLFYQVGAAHMAMELAGVSYTRIPPRRWKPHFGVPSVAQKLSERRTVEIARKMIADKGWALEHSIKLVKHVNRAEALMIGAYWLEVYSDHGDKKQDTTTSKDPNDAW